MPQDNAASFLKDLQAPATQPAAGDSADAFLRDLQTATQPQGDWLSQAMAAPPEDPALTRERAVALGVGTQPSSFESMSGKPRSELSPQEIWSLEHPARSALSSGLYQAGQMMTFGASKYIAPLIDRALGLPGAKSTDDIERQMAAAHEGAKSGGLPTRLLEAGVGASGLLMPGMVTEKLIPEGAGIVRKILTSSGVFGGDRAIQGVVEGEPVLEALKEGGKTAAITGALPVVGGVISRPLERFLSERVANVVGQSAAFGGYGAATAEPGDAGVSAVTDATVGAVLGGIGLFRRSKDPSFESFEQGKRRVYLDPDESKIPTETEAAQRTAPPKPEDLAKSGIEVADTEIGKLYYRPETLRQFAQENGITATDPAGIAAEAKAKNIVGKLLDYGDGNEKITEQSKLVTGRDAEGREIVTIAAENPETAAKALREQHGAASVDEPLPITKIGDVLDERVAVSGGGGKKPPGEFEGTIIEQPQPGGGGSAAQKLSEVAKEEARGRRRRFGQEVFSPQYSSLRKPAPKVFETATRSGAVQNAADTLGDKFQMDMRKILTPEQEHAWVRYQQDANAKALEIQGRTPQPWLKLSDAERMRFKDILPPETLKAANAEFDRQMALVEPYAPTSEYLPSGARRPIDKLNDPDARYMRFSRVFSTQEKRAKDLADIEAREGRPTVLSGPEFTGDTELRGGAGGGPLSKRGLFRRAGSSKRASGEGEAYSLSYGDIIKDTLRDRLYAVTHNRLRDSIREYAQDAPERGRSRYVTFNGKKEPLVAVDIGRDPAWRELGELMGAPEGGEAKPTTGISGQLGAGEGVNLTSERMSARDKLWNLFRGTAGSTQKALPSGEAPGMPRGGGERQSEIVWVPKSIATVWDRHLLPPDTWKLWFPLDKVANGAVRVQLATAGEATMHAANVMGALATTPGIAKTKLGNVISTGLAGRIAPAIKRAYSLDPNDPAFERDLISGIMNGAVRGNTFKEHGGFEDRLPVLGTLKKWVFGPDGVEVRSRLVMFRLLREFDPAMSETEAWNRVNNELGTYVSQLAPAAANALSGTGLDPFARAGVGLGKTALKTLVGRGPDGKFSPERAAIVPAAVMTWALAHRALDDQHRWPWDAGTPFGQLPIGNSNVSVLPILMNPAHRALSLTGLRGAIDAANRDPTVPSAAGGLARGAVNAIAGRMGPLPRAIVVGATSLAGQGEGSLPLIGGPKIGHADKEHPIRQSMKNVAEVLIPQYGDLEHVISHPEIAAEDDNTKAWRYALDFLGIQNTPRRSDTERKASEKKAREALSYRVFDGILYQTRAMDPGTRMSKGMELLSERLPEDEYARFLPMLVDQIKRAPRSTIKAANRADAEDE